MAKSGQKTQKIETAQLKTDIRKIDEKFLRLHGLFKKTWES